MHESELKRYARRLAKGAWWLATPWRMPERLQYLRERATTEARDAELTMLVERDKLRQALRASDLPVESEDPVDLFDDAAVAEVVGLPWDSIYWKPIAAHQVVDKWTAARFCIDLWRGRSSTLRFPRAGNAECEPFGLWFQQVAASALDLPEAVMRHLQEVLDSDFPDRARQYFMDQSALRAVLPEGLTPPGMASLLRWFFRYGALGGELRLEEVWWLFLEAAEDPRHELVLAYLFTPAWQERHPDGLTVFGRDAFAEWFASEYGVTDAWVDPVNWPEWEQPVVQLRISYGARSGWRQAHPDALETPGAARAFLDWLASPEGGLPERQRAWCSQLDFDAVSEQLAQPAVNVIGHFCYPSGLRVSAECLVQAMSLAGVSPSLRDLRTDASDEPRHVHFHGTECNDITILHTQPEPFFDKAYERADLAERAERTYRIAYWYWEFDSIPDSWLPHTNGVDEVWTATEFVARGLRERLSVPVRTMFPGVRLTSFEPRSRAHFGLAKGAYTFLFTFHMMSVMERKNPLGLVRAFKKAFGGDEAVQLVLKTSFGDRHPAQLQELHEAAAGANIKIIDQIYSLDEVLSLMDACDAYVSLHRSEGLGLTMAEAMLMGKPVIATHYSGNVDFMDESNSLPVSYEIVTLEKSIPPYDAGLRWADPSVDDAARQMRRVYENQVWAHQLGERGRASAEANMSLEAAGRRIRHRLEEIRELRARSPRPR